MPFIYRYLDKAGTVKYVGITTGKTIKSLRGRINDHAKDPAFNKKWRCEYAEVATATDVKMLENHFINMHRATVINKQQLDEGPLTLAALPDLPWAPYAGPPQEMRRPGRPLKDPPVPRETERESDNKLIGELLLKVDERDARISQLMDELSATQEWLISAWATLDERAEMCLDCGQPRKAAAV